MGCEGVILIMLIENNLYSFEPYFSDRANDFIQYILHIICILWGHFAKNINHLFLSNSLMTRPTL
jgi:hypothetical protein